MTGTYGDQLVEQVRAERAEQREPETIDEALLAHLHFCIGQMSPFVVHKWIMSPEWFADCRQLARPDGRPLWVPPPGLLDAELLYGAPVEVREGAGPPMLVPADDRG